MNFKSTIKFSWSQWQTRRANVLAMEITFGCSTSGAQLTMQEVIDKRELLRELYKDLGYAPPPPMAKAEILQFKPKD